MDANDIMQSTKILNEEDFEDEMKWLGTYIEDAISIVDEIINWQYRTEGTVADWALVIQAKLLYAKQTARERRIPT